ncbi:hypothetical protein JIN81_15840 [Haloferula rosea]|uniref:Uncharacterized protein n=2 Tax=Haloferula rosea TaxID=490093 RepID=A0A934RDD5_9BACT|nr:hypothetical protein [Haloferula rosea]
MIGRSYGGKSLGRASRTGSVRIQRRQSGGLKAVMQSEKGLQELFIRIDSGFEEAVEQAVEKMA